MAWLDEVLDGLGCESAAIAGHSYGGWIALSYALHAPGRVRSLTLLDPTTCFAGFRPAYLLHAAPLLVRPGPAALRSLLRWETGGAALDPGWLELAGLAAREPKSIVLPRRPRAASFAGFSVPTLVLLGGASRAHDIRAVAAGAARAIPSAQVITIPDATHHTIPMLPAGPINEALLAFL